MDRSRFKRQLFFFLLAVLLPSTALVLFGVGFLTQERELSRNRAEESRVSAARDTGRLLEDRLNEITITASQLRQDGADSLRYPAGNGLLWVGTYDGTQLNPGWAFAQGSPPIDWGQFASDFAQAERLEIRDQNPARATDKYLSLTRLVPDPRNQAIALQRAARSTMKAGRTSEAVKIAERVIETSSALVDENGIPIAYYAADLLLSAEPRDSTKAAISDMLTAAVTNVRWSLPEQSYMLRALSTAAGDSSLAHAASAIAIDVEYAIQLRDDISSLLRAGVTDRWLVYGDRLLGAEPFGTDGHLDFFAMAPDELAVLAQEDGNAITIQFEGEQTAHSLPLRPYVRDAYVTLNSADGPAPSSPRVFLVLGFIVLLGLTLFGGYLLWNDVRRESRLAQLRAQFVSSVSHELRTPLTSIRMFAETMLIDETTPVEDRRRYLGVIANESERLTRMLNNVLSASQIEQGTSSYHPTSGDLRDPVNAAVVAMRYAFEQENVALETEIPNQAVMATIDPDAVEQAVLNLLSNALKYGGGSPVSLAIKTDGNGSSDILVSDSGPGIDPSETALIFDRFYRSESAQHQRTTGTGLGLALVKHIAESHGGRASVHSTPGAGSTFGIHFPITP